jgi:hypothetical protein
VIATSLGSNLAAWLLFPAAVYALSLGVGLLADRLLRIELPNALLAPVGFCVAIVLVAPGYRWGVAGWLGAGLLAGAALLGFALTGRRLPARLNPGWAGLAGLAAYLLYVAPAALSGGWTWLGYNFLNDTAIQFVLVDQVQHHGAQIQPQAASSFLETLKSYFGSHYPLGSHELLSSLDLLVRMPVQATYQPFISAMAGVAGMSLAWVVRRAQAPGWAAALAGFAAVAANLSYQYALQGSIKEIAMLCTLAVSAAVARELLTTRREVGTAVALGLCLAAGLAVYSAAGVPYVGALAAAVVIGLLVQRRPQRSLRGDAIALGAGLVALGVAAIPTLTQIVTFGQVVQGTFSGNASVASQLGQLAAPLKLAQAAGVWLNGDYRFAVGSGIKGDVTDAAIGLMVGLLAVGVVWLLVRRELGPLLYLAAAGLTAAVIAPRVSPYADAKLLAVLAPGVVLAAGAGAIAVGRRLPPLGLALGVVLAGAVLASNALAYHQVRLAVVARMDALHDAGVHARGLGLVLVNESEEFAKYFGRPAEVNVATEPLTPAQIVRRKEDEPFFGHQYDLDLQTLDYVERFPAIVQRRSPAASRPPADYRLAYQNHFYELWTKEPGVQVVDHLPLQSLDDATAPAPCAGVRALAARAAAGDRLVAAVGPQVATFATAAAPDRSPGWVLYPTPGLLALKTPGFARGTLAAPATGTYRVWLRGTFGRPISVYVDGRKVGEAHGPDTPNSWNWLATIRVGAGPHRVELRRARGDLAPGDGAQTLVGPLALERAGSRSLRDVPPAAARTLCGQALDWVELVR